jgi:hypothetical protein
MESQQHDGVVVWSRNHAGLRQAGAWDRRERGWRLGFGCQSVAGLPLTSIYRGMERPGLASLGPTSRVSAWRGGAPPTPRLPPIFMGLILSLGFDLTLQGLVRLAQEAKMHPRPMWPLPDGGPTGDKSHSWFMILNYQFHNTQRHLYNHPVTVWRFMLSKHSSSVSD